MLRVKLMVMKTILHRKVGKDSMGIIKKIIQIIKKKFNKTSNTDMLDEGINNLQDDKKAEYINALKVKIGNRKKRKVETLTCVGDGLGIQNKISY